MDDRLRAEAAGAAPGRLTSTGARRERALLAVGLIATTALLIFAEAPLCPTALFFGIPCPGCGLTRATLALLHGHVHEALAFHPLSPVLAPLFLGAIGKALFDFVRGPNSVATPQRSFWTTRTATVLASLLLIAVLFVWGARFLGYFGGPVEVTSLVSLKRK